MVLSSWQSHCESSPGSFDECRTAPNDLGCESACRLPESTPTIAVYYYCSARNLILILSFDGGYRRLSRPWWLVTYRDGLTARQTVTHPGTNRV